MKELEDLINEVENSPPGTTYQDVVFRLRTLADHIERTNRKPPRWITVLERIWFKLRQPDERN